MIKKYLGYVQNKKFGPYYIPARYQNILLKNYAFLKKKLFHLPQGEPYFSKSNIRLRTMINQINKDEAIICLSIYMLPRDKKLYSKIIDQVILKKTEIHFLFEEIILKNKKDKLKISNLLKLEKFTNEKNQFLETLS